MKLDKATRQLVSETAEGLIRVYGAKAQIQASLIAARMARHKTDHGASMWKEVARAVREMQPEPSDPAA